MKNLDPIMHVQNPLKLRAEALAGVQDVQNLREGTTVIVQPTSRSRRWRGRLDIRPR